MYVDILKKAGLVNKEPAVYNALLHLGDSPASKIIKESELKRGIVYKTLDDLEKKGLVKTYTKNKKTHFKPEHPFKLDKLADEALHKAQIQKSTLSANLAQIIATYNVNENKPGVKVFEGIEGIKQVYEDTLREKPEVLYAVLQTSAVEPQIYNWLNKYYAPKRAKNGIFAKVITTADKRIGKYTKKDKKELRETRIVPIDKFNIGIEMNIYGDKTAFMNFKKGEALMGVVIDNKPIADTMKAVFQLAWEGANTYTTTIAN